MQNVFLLQAPNGHVFLEAFSPVYKHAHDFLIAISEVSYQSNLIFIIYLLMFNYLMEFYWFISLPFSIHRAWQKSKSYLAWPSGNVHFSFSCPTLFRTSPKFSQQLNTPWEHSATLVCRACHCWNLLAWRKNLVAPDYWTWLLSSPDTGHFSWADFQYTVSSLRITKWMFPFISHVPSLYADQNTFMNTGKLNELAN